MASVSRLYRCLIIFSYSVVVSCWFFCVGVSGAGDTLNTDAVMGYDENLESSNKLFQLRFFSLGDPNRHYLGIQCMNISRNYTSSSNYEDQKVVWIFNRDKPVTDKSGRLYINTYGNLEIYGYDVPFQFVVNSEQSARSSNTSATLLNSGNLVLREGKRIVWQSFDYPSDTWLPGMKLGLFMEHPRRRFLTSWVSPQVPSPGAFTLGIDPNNKKELVVWQRGVVYWHDDNWKKGYKSSSFSNDVRKIDIFNGVDVSFFSNENESYFTYAMIENDRYSLLDMGSSGEITIFRLRENMFKLFSRQLSCDSKYVEERSKGCAMPEPSNCMAEDIFIQTSGFVYEWGNMLQNSSLGISDCKEICKRDCTCNIYTYVFPDGSGCKFSRGKRFDSEAGIDTFYIRNNTVVKKDHLPRETKLWLIIGGTLASLIVLIHVSLFFYLRGKSHNSGGMIGEGKDGMNQGTRVLMNELRVSVAAFGEFSDAKMLELSGKKDQQLPFFSFSCIQIATDHFSDANKIGQGGFGPVYKGKLVNGQEIAVKRLSRSSGQGLEEFKNEVILISKLQHRNLVRLLGCCIQQDERILIYEYLPNKSLDSFLFDATKRALLDWKLCVCIIEGIAQGLLYLHKYSRLRIIHRDLKTSNILLDNNMNPKISYFGTARIFGENESRANTSRIVGTYGYMSPEYAMDGLFSVKSDVFSFGVMLLEIISGRKNTGFYQSNRYLNLLGYAWDLWMEGRGSELVDLALVKTCLTSDAMRYVQVGLLCVQESAADRPTMSDVVSMLSNEMVVLPPPKQPAFSTTVRVNETNLPENLEPCSINEVTISEAVGR